MALDYTIIGQRIKQARLAKNLTQEDLAEKIDISVAFLSRVERGNSHINLKRLNQLCRLLDVSEGYILNGASSNSNNYLEQEFAELLKSCSPEKQKLIYNVAKTIANNVIGMPEVELSLIALSPSIFLVSIISVYKGYFNGREKMSVTAKAQSYDQLTKTFITILIIVLIVDNLPS